MGRQMLVALDMGGQPITNVGGIGAASATLGTPLAVASGGTGQSTATAAFDALSPNTTRGDIAVRGATNNVRLAIGSAGKFLRSDGTDPSWQTIAESDVTNLVSDLAAKQPLDSDLTALAGLTATTDNFIVSVASAWASRTPTQARTTLGLGTAATQSADNVFLLDGTVNYGTAAVGIQPFIAGVAAMFFRLGTDLNVAYALGGVLATVDFAAAVNTTNTLGSGVRVRAIAEQAWSAGNAGARLELLTTPIASGTPAIRLNVTNAGTLNVAPTYTSSLTTGGTFAVKADGSIWGGGGLAYTSNEPSDANFKVSTAGNVIAKGTLAVTGATTLSSTTALNGTVTMGDAINIVLNATTGTKIGTATTQKLGFFNATPIVQGTAFTQTYSTASHTHANVSASTPPAVGTGATAGAYDSAANRNAMITSLTNNIADVANLKQVVNGLIDDLQALGLIA